MNLNDFLKTIDPKTLQLSMARGPAILQSLSAEDKEKLKAKIAAMSDSEKQALLSRLKNDPAPAELLKKLSNK